MSSPEEWGAIPYTDPTEWGAVAVDEPAVQPKESGGALTQAGLGITSGFAGLGQAFNSLGEAAFRTKIPGLGVSVPGLFSPELRAVEDQVANKLGYSADVARQAQQDVEQLAKQTEGPALVRKLSSGATSLIPTLATGPLGILGMALTAGGQSFGSQYEEAQEFGMQQGLTKEQASNKALLPAAASGAITATLTRLFPGGSESILSKAGLGNLKAALPRIIKGFFGEATEEGIDQVGQSIVQKLSSRPGMTLAEAAQQSLEAAAIGGILGGAVTGVSEIGQRTLPPLPDSNRVSGPPLLPLSMAMVDMSLPITPEAFGTIPPSGMGLTTETAPAAQQGGIKATPEMLDLLPGVSEMRLAARVPEIVGERGENVSLPNTVRPVERSPEMPVARNLEPIITPEPQGKFVVDGRGVVFAVQDTVNITESERAKSPLTIQKEIELENEYDRQVDEALKLQIEFQQPKISQKQIEGTLPPPPSMESEESQQIATQFQQRVPSEQQRGQTEFDRPLNPQIQSEEKQSVLGQMEIWADNKIKESKGRSYTGVDPELMAAYVVKGVSLINKGITTASEFASRMVQEFGSDIAPHVKTIYRNSQKARQDYFQPKEQNVQSETILPTTPQSEVPKTVQAPTDPGRERIFGTQEKNIGPVVIPAGKSQANVVDEPKDYHRGNNINSGQWIFGRGRLGEAAKKAWETMQLAVFDVNHAVGKDVKQFVDGTLKSIPRAFRKGGGKAFYEVLDGKDMGQIISEWSNKLGGKEIIQAAQNLKNRLEEIRVTIRDTKASGYKTGLGSFDKPTLEGLYQANVGAVNQSMTKAQMIDALVLNEYPMDWGISDGSYLPHLFSGTWRISASVPGQQGPQFINRAKTVSEAKAIVYKLTKQNPDLANAQFTIEQDTVIPDEVLRLGDKQLFSLISRMKESLAVSASEIKEAQSGIIGRKASKQKWNGFLQKRQGFENYSKDFEKTLTAYFSGFHRWKIISKAQSEVVPLIEQVKSEGRDMAGIRLDELMDNLWGKPSNSTIEIDKLFAQTPLKDYFAPLWADRWSGKVRSIVSNLSLNTPRFWILNRLQPLFGLYPLVGEEILFKGFLLHHSAEGRALLDSAGVTFDPGQYSSGARGKLQNIRERITGERSNQELAFLSMYLHGKKQGLSDPEAIKYGKLRGQLMTQFTPSSVDNPRLFEGPVAGLAFQFKRFTVKQVELIAQMAADKNVPGMARMIAVYALMGGAAFFLKQSWQDDRTKKRVERALKSELGERGANGLMYGIPGLLGADVSSSVVLGEEPYGEGFYEKFGRMTTGPTVSFVIGQVGDALTQERVDMTGTEKVMRALRKFPTTRQLAELYDMSTGNIDITTPDGETKYRKTLKDTLMAMGSFKSTSIASENTRMGAIMELKKEREQIKNEIFVSMGNKESAKKVEQKVTQFNMRWPESAITGSEINQYIQGRIKGYNKTDLERMEGKRYRNLK